MIIPEKTLVEVLEILRQRGYTEDFNLLEVRDSYKKEGGKVDVKDIVIDKTYRFFGQSDIDDEAVLYAMRNLKDGAKGVFVNAYGANTDPEATEIIRQIISVEDDTDDWTV